MAGRFKFKLLTGDNPDSQYTSIQHDDYTFYLLGNGKGFLGDIPLFGSAVINAVQTLNLDIDESTASQIPSVAAVTNHASNLFGGERLHIVGSHTLTEEDFKQENLIIPKGCEAGDSGLLFMADNDTSADETYYFVSLAEYLTSVHSFASTKSIVMNVSETNEVTADLNVHKDERSIIVDGDGVYLNKTTQGINTNEPDDQKIVTETALIEYINSVLASVNTVT